MKNALVAISMFALYMGCASVPDVQFVANANDGGGGGDGGGDGGPPNNDSGPAPEAGAPMCGGRELPAGATCCDIACVGYCYGGNKCRDDCAPCAASGICCRKGTNPNNATATCAPTPADCP